MKPIKISSLQIDEERIDLFEGRTLSYDKCALAYFAGPEGWGVTMNIQLGELDDFVNSKQWQRNFIAHAKDKLGMAA
ncbi:hypothetical protein OTK51_18135 [Vibrio scophthalmi]|uniref:hypothetical protein n=1 Tax=Vibrio scophthalmi TaxID=45658 RepID=UPI0022842C64|nr:hypothetical protein [Vibrio scophthalmi]MCY9805346.1 hypothetical protein [Vibrio scophthalmi]